MNIEQYEKLISQVLAEKFDGLELWDMEDQPTADWLEDGVTAYEAVGMIVDSSLCDLFDDDIRYRY